MTAANLFLKQKRVGALPKKLRLASHRIFKSEEIISTLIDGKQALADQKTNVIPDGSGECGVEGGLTPAKNRRAECGVKRQLKKKPGTPTVRGCGHGSMAARRAYVDAIRRVLPALGDVFSPTATDVVEKPLGQRSTDELIAQIDAGRFPAEIARLWRVPLSEWNKWVTSDVDRLARVSFARKNQAMLWDWVALQVLLHAPSERVEIMRAEKIAQHCRWRAKVFDRDAYGQNVKITRMDDRDAHELSTRELEIIARGDVLPG